LESLTSHTLQAKELPKMLATVVFINDAQLTAGSMVFILNDAVVFPQS
jgi:hypothetical protein